MEIADLVPVAGQPEMDPRLLQYYNLELQHLREMGAEFAQQFPKVAARLGMSGLEVADPYVERLLEGVGFLAARVQLKLDAEFPRFTQALLEIVHPHYLAPTPSMLVAQFKPDPGESEPGDGTENRAARKHDAGADVGRRGDRVRVQDRARRDACGQSRSRRRATSPSRPTFRSTRSPLPSASREVSGSGSGPPPDSSLRRRRSTASASTSAGRDDVANKLHELCLAHGLGALVLPGKGAPRWHEFLPASSIRPVGFTDEQALLPVALRSFQGYRLLQEYFSFPQRFRFFELSGLRPGVARTDGDEIELVILLGRGDADAREHRRRLQLRPVLHARHQPLPETRWTGFMSTTADTSITSWQTGRGRSTSRCTRSPMSSATASAATARSSSGSSIRRSAPTTRIRIRPISRCGASRAWCRRRRNGAAPVRAISAAKSFSDSSIPLEAPFSGDLRQLSVQAFCTNRDLVLQMPIGAGQERLLSRRRRAGRRHPRGERPEPAARAARGWRDFVARDQPSRRSTTCRWSMSAPRKGAATLRGLLELYAPAADVSARTADRGHQVGDRQSGCAPAARAAGRSHSAGDSASRWRSTTWRSKVAAPTCSGRCSIAISRATCRSIRSPKPSCDRRAGAKSIDGCHIGARERRCRVLRRAGGGALPLRFLPDAAPAGVPVARQAALGQGAQAR